MNGKHQLLVFANDINMLRENFHIVRQNTGNSIKASNDVGLEVYSVLKLAYTLFETLFISNETRQKYNFRCAWSIRHWKSIRTRSSFFTCLNKYSGKLSLGERQWLLKCCWKVENVVEVQRSWRVEFGTPPTRITITRIREKFEVDGTCKMCWKVGEEEKEVSLITRVLMQSCRFLHDPQGSHWGNVLMRLVSRNTVFIEF